MCVLYQLIKDRMKGSLYSTHGTYIVTNFAMEQLLVAKAKKQEPAGIHPLCFELASNTLRMLICHAGRPAVRPHVESVKQRMIKKWIKSDNVSYNQPIIHTLQRTEMVIEATVPNASLLEPICNPQSFSLNFDTLTRLGTKATASS